MRRREEDGELRRRGLSEKMAERERGRNSRREKWGGKGERKGASEVANVTASNLRLTKIKN